MPVDVTLYMYNYMHVPFVAKLLTFPVAVLFEFWLLEVGVAFHLVHSRHNLGCLK